MPPSVPSPSVSAGALEGALSRAARMFVRIDEAASSRPMRADGWSARQTLGHLIDSACNNHRRFVSVQTGAVSRFEPYDQDGWVRCQRHDLQPWSALVALWTAYNTHLVHVMRQTAPEAAGISAAAPDRSAPVMLGALMADYVTHLDHHVAQIAAFAETLPRYPVGPPVTGEAAEEPPLRTVSGRRHDFEPLDPERHVPDLFAGTQGPDAEGMWTYLPYGPFESEAAMGVWLGACAASRDPRFFSVVERRTGRAVGMCSLMRIEPAMRTIELGHIWYIPEVQGAGVNTDMALTFLSACFDEWGYRRVEWKCDALNARSRAAALGLGFRFEGIFRQHMVRKGHNRDTAWYAMLDGEWPEARRALEARLASAPGG